MRVPLTRREVLLALTAVAGVGAGAATLLRSPSLPRTPAEHLAAAVLAALDVPDPVALGRRARALDLDLAAASALLDDLLTTATTAPTWAAVTEALRARQRHEFATGQILTIDGWRLSPTDLAICTWTTDALDAARRRR